MSSCRQSRSALTRLDIDDAVYLGHAAQLRAAASDSHAPRSLPFLVRDNDGTLAFYIGKLGFELVEDTPEHGKRWVTVRPPGAPTPAATILLPSAAFPTMLRIAGTLGGSACATAPEQAARIGDQTGGRVAFFLHTDDFAWHHARNAR